MLCQFLIFLFAVLSPLSVFVGKLHCLFVIEEYTTAQSDGNIHLTAIIPDCTKANFRTPWLV